MKFWFGCALCIWNWGFSQVPSFGLPPLEQGLAGAGITSSFEGSSVLPTSSVPDGEAQMILYHGAPSGSEPFNQNGFRVFGSARRYAWSADVHRAGLDGISAHQIRAGTSILMNEHRMGARLVAEQWYPTEGRTPFRIYPEIAFWSQNSSRWNYAFVLSNPTRVRWTSDGPKTSITARAGVRHTVLDGLDLHLSWMLIDSFHRISVSAEWQPKPNMGAVFGITSGNHWGSLGWWIQWKPWRLHTSAQFNQLLGWAYQVGLLRSLSH